MILSEVERFLKNVFSQVRKEGILLTFSLLAFSLPHLANAQETPPLLNYSPSLYKAHNQNWSIGQSSDKLLYAGNSDGLLEFDGATWKVYPFPNRQMVRSILCDDFRYPAQKSGASEIEQRIYVGGFAEFGYWRKEPDGQLTYHSLSKRANFKSLKTEEIWHILKTPQYIYFQSFSKIYRYDGNELREMKVSGNFMFLRYVRNRLLIQLIGKGLFELKDEKFIPIQGTEILSQTIVSSVLPFSENRILIATTKNGLFILGSNGLVPWEIPVSGELKRNLLNKAILLTNDNSFVFGTIQKGLYVVSSDGVLKYRINKENGLQNNTVLALAEDRRKHLWIGLDQGIDMVKISSPAISYQTHDNPLGTTYAAAIWRNNLYVGSNNGVFVKKWQSNEKFRPIPGLGGQTWNLMVVDDQLLCGHNDATYRIEDEHIEKISEITGGWVFLRVKGSNDSLLLQGAYNGLHVYRKNKQNRWTYGYAVKGVPILPIRQIVQDRSGWFWLRHAYKGLYRARLSANLDSALIWREYKEPADIPSEFSVEITNLDNIIRIRSGNRFFKAESNGNLIPDKDLDVKSDEPYKLRSGIGTDWFKVYANRVDYYRNGKVTHLDLALIRNNEHIISISNNDYFFCLDNGYALYKRSLGKVESNAVTKPMIRKVANLRDLSQTFGLSSGTSLPSEIRSIRIMYALPVYGQSVQFKYRLTGLSDQWSEWTDQNFVEFTNLESTSYSFQVKSSLDNLVTSYDFEIQPFWYETRWARFLFILLAAIFMIGLALYQEKRILRHRQKLIREQEEKLRQERLSSERKIMEIQNEKLQSEIKSKSQQISNVAINVVRKNEILEEIRDELKQVKEELGQQLPNLHYQKLLHSIERNVAGKDDWVLFEENFNEVHEEFFKRLKKICPVISPSELRLAACLRMNLSTKEMAPALGISVRGVEIKRYRLRKKLNLDNESNLVDYMMEV
jgi:DNA-binding CsgD family transcriptional regulator